jgi:hypothetical protein
LHLPNAISDLVAQNQPWLWSITTLDFPASVGHAATREQAMADFKRDGRLKKEKSRRPRRNCGSLTSVGG